MGEGGGGVCGCVGVCVWGGVVIGAGMRIFSLSCLCSLNIYWVIFERTVGVAMIQDWLCRVLPGCR